MNIKKNNCISNPFLNLFWQKNKNILMFKLNLKSIKIMCEFYWLHYKDEILWLEILCNRVWTVLLQKSKKIHEKVVFVINQSKIDLQEKHIKLNVLNNYMAVTFWFYDYTSNLFWGFLERLWENPIMLSYKSVRESFEDEKLFLNDFLSDIS